jgi:hypothetical protein
LGVGFGRLEKRINGEVYREAVCAVGTFEGTVENRPKSDFS